MSVGKGREENGDVEEEEAETQSHRATKRAKKGSHTDSTRAWGRRGRSTDRATKKVINVQDTRRGDGGGGGGGGVR